MEIDPSTLPWRSVYKLMTGAVLPRPIGWISTVSAAGQPNLAPFSFFNVVCANPPTLLFCPMIRSSTGAPKDSWRNVAETGEFVVNIVSESLADAMNSSSPDVAPDVNEFDLAGVTAIPSAVVKAPRVAESLIHFECRLREIVEIGSEAGGGAIVIGTVVHVHVDESVLIGEDKINAAVLRPIGRMAGNDYCRATDIFQMENKRG